MPTSRFPIRVRLHTVTGTLARACRERAARGQTRREHDLAIEADPRFALEHSVHVARSIDMGRGGCPYCE